MAGFSPGEPYRGPFPRGGDVLRPKRFTRSLALTALSGSRILTVGPGAAWVDQSPQYLVQGETIPFTLAYNGATTITSPTNTLYLDGTDVSSDSLTGSAAVNGNTVLTKSVTAVTGDNRYVLVTTATVDSATAVRKLLIIVNKPADDFGGQCWVREGAQWIVEGESLAYTIALARASLISGTPTVKVYKDGTDVTSTNMPSGSASVSGLTITLPSLTSVTGGRYVVAVTASVDGRTEIRKILVYAQNAEEET